jgi:lipoprotein-releasing system permease protein
MTLRLIFFIAVRYIFARLRSTVTVLLGVGIGVFVMAVMQSLMFGFQGEFMRILYTVTPSILVKGRERGLLDEGRVYRSEPGVLYEQTRLKPVEKEKGIRNYQTLIRRIETIPDIQAVAPLVQGRAMLRYGTRERGVNLIGLQAPQYDRVIEFRSKVEGDVDEFMRRSDGAILGAVLAEEMGIIPGARLKLVGVEGREADVRVVALFKSGITMVDRTNAFINLRLSQSLLDYPAAITGMAIKVRDGVNPTPVARQVEYAAGLETQSWEEINAPFFALIRQQNSITLGAVAMTVLVAGFGIANGLITAVLEKRLDIGILRALGLTARGITAIFVAEGVLIGMLGTAAGLGAAAWAIAAMDDTALPGRGGLSSTTTFVMLRGPAIYALCAAYAFVVSFVASLFPALRASRYDPVEIIRTAK